MTVSATAIDSPQAGASHAPDGAATIIDNPLGAGPAGSALEASRALCARIVRTRARNFYHGLRLLPEPKRSAMYAIYAWMRAADDAVDTAGSTEERRRRLHEFRERTDDLLAGRRLAASEVNGDAVIWPSLIDAMARFPIDRRILLDTLSGMEDDLTTFQYQSRQELSTYCYRVASTVGLACVRVWGLKDPSPAGRARADELAIMRGQAFQRTNILRDFAQDFDESPRRVYVPREELDRHGLTAEDLRAWARPGACESLVREFARTAREFYEASSPLDGMLEDDSRATLWAMTSIYSGILRIIEREPRRIVSGGRIRLPGLEKAALALRAVMKSRTQRW